MTGKGFKDADNQAPLFLRTTEEMLDEFSFYLGSEKAEEIVITNTNMIADMCDRIAPVRPDKCPPVIENSDQQLTDICYRKAHEMYGEELETRAEFYHQQWICRYVYHCTEAGVEVCRRRIPGRFTRFCRIFFRGYNGGNHGG